MRGTRARELRASQPEPLPPGIRAELRARVADAARHREAVIGEAKRQRRMAEQAAAEAFERVRGEAHRQFEAARDQLRAEAERAAG